MTTKTNPAPKTASVKAENTRKAPGNVKEVTNAAYMNYMNEIEQEVFNILRKLSEGEKVQVLAFACKVFGERKFTAHADSKLQQALTLGFSFVGSN
jgi:hypothetical protein